MEGKDGWARPSFLPIHPSATTPLRHFCTLPVVLDNGYLLSWRFGQFGPNGALSLGPNDALSLGPNDALSLGPNDALSLGPNYTLPVVFILLESSTFRTQQYFISRTQLHSTRCLGQRVFALLGSGAFRSQRWFTYALSVVLDNGYVLSWGVGLFGPNGGLFTLYPLSWTSGMCSLGEWGFSVPTVVYLRSIRCLGQRVRALLGSGAFRSQRWSIYALPVVLDNGYVLSWGVGLFGPNGGLFTLYPLSWTSGMCSLGEWGFSVPTVVYLCSTRCLGQRVFALLGSGAFWSRRWSIYALPVVLDIGYVLSWGVGLFGPSSSNYALRYIFW
ncbi:hypothetical protein VKT23_019933 [Stygiomarasmius scandens]|uniref:Uncharacterized protein n=1 Tax=Marasmiellus scandens TaxID=2682957 RepID=A0ABR1IK40_9AGAR